MEYYTPSQLAEAANVAVETVLKWIHSGRIKASNIAMTTTRPRWRIHRDDVKAFMDERSNRKEKPSKIRKCKAVKKYV